MPARCAPLRAPAGSGSGLGYAELRRLGSAGLAASGGCAAALIALRAGRAGGGPGAHWSSAGPARLGTAQPGPAGGREASTGRGGIAAGCAALASAALHPWDTDSSACPFSGVTSPVPSSSQCRCSGLVPAHTVPGWAQVPLGLC